MFGDDWTPAHLTGGPTNLYKEIAFALKGAEWRQPGLVAVASKLAGSAAEHKPIDVVVPDSYEPKAGPNPWTAALDLSDAKALPNPVGSSATAYTDAMPEPDEPEDMVPPPASSLASLNA